MVEKFEVLVIGGGGAGYAAASTAARMGKRVAMAARGKLGGTCLNIGGVPSKALMRAAYVAEDRAASRRVRDCGRRVQRLPGAPLPETYPHRELAEDRAQLH